METHIEENPDDTSTEKKVGTGTESSDEGYDEKQQEEQPQQSQSSEEKQKEKQESFVTTLMNKMEEEKTKTMHLKEQVEVQEEQLQQQLIDSQTERQALLVQIETLKVTHAEHSKKAAAEVFAVVEEKQQHLQQAVRRNSVSEDAHKKELLDLTQELRIKNERIAQLNALETKFNTQQKQQQKQHAKALQETVAEKKMADQKFQKEKLEKLAIQKKHKESQQLLRSTLIR